jgi:hypothetical protein
MTGDRQHIVPQQVIRRFAGADGKLRVLRKPSLTFDGRPKSPKSLFHADKYYCGTAVNLDEHFRKIEDNFGKIYPELADAPVPSLRLEGHRAHTFLDWCVAQICRTELLSGMTEIANENIDPEVREAILPIQSDLALGARYYFFLNVKRAFEQAKLTWRLRECKTSEIVITDHPVCHMPGRGGPFILVPLSKHRIIMGGSRLVLSKVAGWDSTRTNLFLAGWAGERICAASSETLERVKKDIERAETAPVKTLFSHARLPFFGMLQRMRENFSTIPDPTPPVEQSASEWLSRV